MKKTMPIIILLKSSTKYTR